MQSAPSAASMTDDDSDMEQDLDEGDVSGFDDEIEYEDANDEEEEDEDTSPTHHKSVTWSPSPSSPALDHGRAHLYQDSESHIIASPCSSPPRHLHSPSSSSRINHTYTPSSSAYIQACRDSTVSTTLRPAFR
jgi:hypothetical protein